MVEVMHDTLGKFADLYGSYWYYIGTAAVGLLVLVLFYRKLTGPKLPPGPFAWPVIGNIPHMGTQPHISLLNLSKKYGPLMYMQLGSVPTIVIQSPEMAKEVLRTQDHIWASRPLTIVGEVFFYDRQDLLFAPIGPLFKLLRRTCVNSLFTPKRIQQFQAVRKEMITLFIQKLLQECKGGKPATVDNMLKETNFNNISKILYGKSYYGLKTKNVDGSLNAREFHEIPELWAKVAGGVIVGDYLPFLRPLDIGGCEALLKTLREEFNVFLTSVIEEHRQRVPAPGTEDFVDVLLTLPADDQGHRLTEIQIKSFLQDLTLGGIDTTTTGIFWPLLQLMRHPEHRKKVQEELDVVVGRDRLVDESDLPRLPYLRATIKEAFRVPTAVPFLAPRESLEACKIAGYDIPKGTRLIVNAYAIHNSPEFWLEPEKFDPDRFLDPKNPVKHDEYKYIPFGGGRRMCPGMDSATLFVESFLARLLHCCDLSLPEGMIPQDVDSGASFGVTLAPTTSLRVIATPRLTLKVYKDAGIAL
ncbi:hypothetical protein R1sor_011726 [Riccia sorocarpa]|uniref:Cytochrome P450 n=1 Tax=Riccia sorocarpa TaxID=122646 RepID=A0ABD3I1N9_9MARC